MFIWALNYILSLVASWWSATDKVEICVSNDKLFSLCPVSGFDRDFCATIKMGERRDLVLIQCDIVFELRILRRTDNPLRLQLGRGHCQPIQDCSRWRISRELALQEGARQRESCNDEEHAEPADGGVQDLGEDCNNGSGHGLARHDQAVVFRGIPERK